MLNKQINRPMATYNIAGVTTTWPAVGQIDIERYRPTTLSYLAAWRLTESTEDMMLITYLRTMEKCRAFDRVEFINLGPNRYGCLFDIITTANKPLETLRWLGRSVKNMDFYCECPYRLAAYHAGEDLMRQAIETDDLIVARAKDGFRTPADERLAQVNQQIEDLASDIMTAHDNDRTD